MRKLSSLLLLALCLLSLRADGAAHVPSINPAAIIPCRSKSGAGSFAIGAGVVFTGNRLVDGAEVDAPTAGAPVDLIVYDKVTSETASTKCLLVGASLVQLKAGAAVTRGDLVKIADTAGRWVAATAGDKAAQFRALQTAATNALFWARPSVGEVP